MAVVCLFFAAAALALFKRNSGTRKSLSARKQPALPGSVTYTKDVASILWENCANCHRPGQAGPFSLLTYEDARKHAREIAEVTRNRLMPPWPPEPGYNEFVGQRILNPDQLDKIQQWVAGGTPEGNKSDLSAPPAWPEDWPLGKPDLVVTLPQSYTLPAEGRDIYRNFVAPIPLSSARYVEAVDFRAGNRAVHHVYVLFDRTKQSRRLDDETPEAGFGGMNVPGNAQSPASQFLSWQPGKLPRKGQNGSAWKLEKDADLVLQMHMQPTGKPESIQPSVAFYFTDQPSTDISFKMNFSSFDIDIPAGATNYTVRDSYSLPVDVEVMAVLPHAHYLGKQLQSFAVLPDGTKKWLLLIRDWNFNWQGDYRYTQPIKLPKGSTLYMDFTYDNSTNNIRNPNNPPRQVQYGLQTTDEMANLAFLFRLASTHDLAVLQQNYQFKAAQDIIHYNQYALRQNPDDARAHAQLGKVFLALGRKAEAQQHLEKSIALNPRSDDSHYHLAIILEDQNKLPAARTEYEAALIYNPENLPAYNNLGLLCLKTGDLDAAEKNFNAALRLNPGEETIRENLRLLQKARRQKRTH